MGKKWWKRTYTCTNEGCKRPVYNGYNYCARCLASFSLEERDDIWELTFVGKD